MQSNVIGIEHCPCKHTANVQSIATFGNDLHKQCRKAQVDSIFHCKYPVVVRTCSYHFISYRILFVPVSVWRCKCCSAHYNIHCEPKKTHQNVFVIS